MINSAFPFELLAGNNIWQSAVILVVVFAILKLIKGTSAEERSWSWCASLFALALLPMSTFLPGEGITMAPEAVTIENVQQRSDVAMIARDVAPVKKATLAELPINVVKLPKVSKSDVMTALYALWFIGSIIALLKIIQAAHNAYKIRRSAYPFMLEDELASDWPDSVEIALSDEISGPLVIGFLKPLVVLPKTFVNSLSRQELKPLLLHELAHIKRHDNLFYLVEKIVLAFYWWNPIMHYIAARISEERELACDDRAALQCGDQMKYAKSLLSGAKQLVGQSSPVLGMAVLRRETVLSKRVKRLTVAKTLGELDLKRLSKKISLLVISVLVLGLATPRVEVSNAQAIAPKGDVVSAINDMDDISDDAVPAYTKALIEDYDLKKEDYVDIAWRIGKIEDEEIKDEAVEHIMGQDNLDEDIEKAIMRPILGDKTIAEIRADIQNAMREIEIDIDVDKIRADVKDAIENLPTEEMILEMEVAIKESFENIPSQLDMENMRSEIEEILVNLPDMVDVEEIRVELEEEFDNLRIEFDQGKMRLEMERALAELPTKEDLEQMKEDLKRDLADIPSVEEIKEMREEMKRELESLTFESPVAPVAPVAPKTPTAKEESVSF